jgi:hypothetical protein
METDPDYSGDVELWLMLDDYEVDCPEKIDILTHMFSKSAVSFTASIGPHMKTSPIKAMRMILSTPLRMFRTV